MRLRELRKLVEEIVGGGGGGSSILHETDIPDQTVTITEEPFVPQSLVDLWQVTGPGLITVVIWGEVKPADNLDTVAFELRGEMDEGGSSSVNIGPITRQYAAASEVLTGGWVRFSAQVQPVVLMPTNTRDYELRISGFLYHDDDPADTSVPISGPVQIRNVHVAAIRLG